MPSLRVDPIHGGIHFYCPTLQIDITDHYQIRDLEVTVNVIFMDEMNIKCGILLSKFLPVVQSLSSMIHICCYSINSTYSNNQKLQTSWGIYKEKSPFQTAPRFNITDYSKRQLLCIFRELHDKILESFLRSFFPCPYRLAKVPKWEILWLF